MTLCIAAHAMNEDIDSGVSYGCVVTCTDMRLETATASSENTSKTRLVGEYRWKILMAGTLPLAEELVALFDQELKTRESNLPILERLRKPIEIFRRRAASGFTTSRYALGYDDFMRNGQSWFGDTLYREALADLKNYISEQERQVQLLIIGCDQDELISIYKYSAGDLWQCGDFAAIGAGETIAEAILHFRNVTDLMTVEEVAFCVLEAKRFGGITPGVGDITRLSLVDVSWQDNGETCLCTRSVGEEGFKFLATKLAMFSARPFVPSSPVPENFLALVGMAPTRPEFEPDPPPTTDDPLPQRPSLESHEGSGES